LPVPTVPTVAEALRRAAAKIGGDSGRLDAELLLAAHLGVDRTELLLRPFCQRAIDAGVFAGLVARRIVNEPVAYITGSCAFWSFDLAVTSDVLIPRPDSETLIEVALRQAPDARRILDLGTGSGALLLAALVDRPHAFGIGVDRSPAALAVARANAAAHGLADRAAFVIGNWATALTCGFDLVLANPPYVRTDAALAPDLAYEPATALFAGEDGLDAYRALIPDLARLLTPSGLAVVEIGHDQAHSVCVMASQAGLSATIAQDLAGRDRALALRRKA